MTDKPTSAGYANFIKNENEAQDYICRRSKVYIIKRMQQESQRKAEEVQRERLQEAQKFQEMSKQIRDTRFNEIREAGESHQIKCNQRLHEEQESINTNKEIIFRKRQMQYVQSAKQSESYAQEMRRSMNDFAISEKVKLESIRNNNINIVANNVNQRQNYMQRRRQESIEKYKKEYMYGLTIDQYKSNRNQEQLAATKRTDTQMPEITTK